ncbi:hypothetical protein LOTGIDRAFT_159879 [Lottia gigantea]|uniref:Globin n=1 Tax=Lottia gigantea TaxID=225164 RepID=V4ARY3_LOTGI|nr:hypothetical protein LOTGIDRAFT_159879 [Lottia gigantea]ESO96466.1 hypothetical protein LOTGIDRAFT_159879 [Lottia gigantea]
MGCTISATIRNKGIKDLPGYLTQREVDIVQKTWAILSTDMMGTGVYMFQRLFEIQKDLQKLFRKLLLPSETADYFFDEVKLQSHAMIVMQGLGAAVESLDDSVYLTNILLTMGEKHSQYNVQPEMISLLWPAIRDALKHKLKEDFTPETELAWRHVFDYISSNMAEGIRNGQNKVKSNKAVKS